MSLIRPMLATAGEVPPGRSDDFGFEVEWDGVRLVTYVDGDSVKTFTRNDREVAATYPEVTQLAEALDGRPAVLDGESWRSIARAWCISGRCSGGCTSRTRQWSSG